MADNLNQKSIYVETDYDNIILVDPNKVVINNEVKERFVKLGAEAMPMSPEGFNQFIKSEMDVASRISKAANLKAN